MLGTLSGAMMTAARTDTLRTGMPNPAPRVAAPLPRRPASKTLTQRLKAVFTPAQRR